MGNALKAGIIYGLLMFCVGFAFGVARRYVFDEALGPQVSLLIEAPIMVLISWAVCGWALPRFLVPRGFAPRLLMGVVGFAVLLSAEIVLSKALFGASVAGTLSHMTSASRRFGFVAQIIFALIPLVRR